MSQSPPYRPPLIRRVIAVEGRRFGGSELDYFAGDFDTPRRDTDG